MTTTLTALAEEYIPEIEEERKPWQAYRTDNLEDALEILGVNRRVLEGIEKKNFLSGCVGFVFCALGGLLMPRYANLSTSSEAILTFCLTAGLPLYTAYKALNKSAKLDNIKDQIFETAARQREYLATHGRSMQNPDGTLNTESPGLDDLTNKIAEY